VRLAHTSVSVEVDKHGDLGGDGADEHEAGAAEERAKSDTGDLLVVDVPGIGQVDDKVVKADDDLGDGGAAESDELGDDDTAKHDDLGVGEAANGCP